MGRREFATGGFGALALALTGGPAAAQANLTDAERANIQAVRDFHKAVETLNMENLTRVTSDDVVVWTPGLGPTAHVGRDAVFKAWMDVMKQRNGVGLRADIHEILYAKGPYVILTRDDWRIGPDGQPTNAGTNIMGLYAIRNGKVGLWYNPGGGPPAGARGAPANR
jgi:limonene-1,2-epoxide hydrolase